MPDRTVLGPLTTTFTYPSSCSVVVKDCLTCERGYQAQTCGTNPSNGQGVQDDPDCWPERSNNDLTTGFAFNGWGIYSPGIHCPDGYTTACAATAGIDGGFPFQYSLEKSETAIGCCPSGFHCQYAPGIDAAQTCYQVVSTGSFPTVQCSSQKSNSFSYLSIPATVTVETTPASETQPSETSVVLDKITVLAPMFQLNWQATDRTAVTTDPASSTGGNAQPSDHGDGGGSSGGGSSGGLSTGATAGIGVAAGVIGLAAIGALVWFIRKRRAAKAQALSAQAVQPQEWKQPAPYSGGPYSGGYVAELGTAQVSELPDSGPPRY